jgi:hypothetical protein
VQPPPAANEPSSHNVSTGPGKRRVRS